MSNNELLLTWTSHPFRDNSRNSIILVFFIIILAASLWRIAVIEWEMPLFYYLGMIIFLGSLIPYFIPTTYELYNKKIRVFYWFIKMERSYSDFGSYYSDKRGVMLSTFKMPRRLDAFRGLNLRFSKTRSEKEKLFEILEEKIGNRA
ncbi:MAG: hypothetical protein K9N09_04615 [Candidatus Cloacimonetes bacterium]|nr:hypothetical protein [Candidatus Cloacimonadota bacterium]MCF7814107.1 hypothetical protein [Candidatus Cloacimonadota bacterium]MCF7867964.1 hypothetical protein [Candidatus Cloacimonadota bacterium]MCF7883422.1 hypothetical protein [Candidatus Cloacimonadota bacterium]